MIIVISTYHFSFLDHPRVHKPRARGFLTFLSQFSLVLLFVSASGILTFVAYLGTLPHIAPRVQPQRNVVYQRDRRPYNGH